MPKFYVDVSFTVYRTWRYEVEADNEEAIGMEQIDQDENPELIDVEAGEAEIMSIEPIKEGDSAT